MRPRLVIARLILVVAALLVAFSPPERITSAQTPTITNDQDLTRGIESYKQGRYSEAAKLLKTVANKSKSDAHAWYYLGLALLQQGKESAH
jgi:Flp pilus assembly protein TadD